MQEINLDRNKFKSKSNELTIEYLKRNKKLGILHILLSIGVIFVSFINLIILVNEKNDMKVKNISIDKIVGWLSSEYEPIITNFLTSLGISIVIFYFILGSMIFSQKVIKNEFSTDSQKIVLRYVSLISFTFQEFFLNLLSIDNFGFQHVINLFFSIVFLNLGISYFLDKSITIIDRNNDLIKFEQYSPLFLSFLNTQRNLQIKNSIKYTIQVLDLSLLSKFQINGYSLYRYISAQELKILKENTHDLINENNRFSILIIDSDRNKNRKSRIEYQIGLVENSKQLLSFINFLETHLELHFCEMNN